MGCLESLAKKNFNIEIIISNTTFFLFIKNSVGQNIQLAEIEDKQTYQEESSQVSRHQIEDVLQRPLLRSVSDGTNFAIFKQYAVEV